MQGIYKGIGVLLKNRNSWDVIINRSMNKTTTGTGMQLTFDYIYQNGVPGLNATKYFDLLLIDKSI